MRDPSLRQLEALIAVIDTGTVSRAADLLRISQPAVSKLIQDLEADTGLQLFERESGRLVTTDRGMRLYEEVDRIFGGVRQIARAVDDIRREEHGHLNVGVMPALSGQFMGQVLKAFRQRFPNVFISVDTRSSQYLSEGVMLRRYDVAIARITNEHPSVTSEPFKSPPMVAVLPKGHPLTDLDKITPYDLVGHPFIAFSNNEITRKIIDSAMSFAGVELNIIIEATTTQSVGEYVAAGLGVTIGDPLSMEFVSNRVIIKPFEPHLNFQYTVIRPVRARKSILVSAFIEVVMSLAQKEPLISG